MKSEKRLSRIVQLISRLEAGEDVSRSSLARVLTPEQMADLDESWKTEKASRKEPKPSEICRYESLLGPDGQFKFPHPWPPQIPPGSTFRL